MATANHTAEPGTEMSDTEYFKSVPWCAKHLDHPDATIVIPGTRDETFIRETMRGRTLMSHTLNTSETVSRFLFCHSPPDPETSIITELKAFMTLGVGVTGWPGTLHGGMVSLILDEVMGSLAPTNVRAGLLPKSHKQMTGYLNTTYLRPVLTTQAAILVVARLTKREGRKWFVDAVIEDGAGTTLSKGSALFITLKEGTKL